MPISLNCPNCDRPVTLDTELCPGCHQPIVMSSIALRGMSPLELNHRAASYLGALASNPGSAELNASLGVCYVSLGLFDKAIPLLDKAIDLNPANADSYYMAAVARLRGKSPYMAKRDDINKVIELLNAANMVAPKAIYFYLLGFVKEKYFEAKYLNVVPSAAQEYASAQKMGIYDDEIQALKELIRC